MQESILLKIFDYTIKLIYAIILTLSLLYAVYFPCEKSIAHATIYFKSQKCLQIQFLWERFL